MFSKYKMELPSYHTVVPCFYWLLPIFCMSVCAPFFIACLHVFLWPGWLRGPALGPIYSLFEEDSDLELWLAGLMDSIKMHQQQQKTAKESLAEPYMMMKHFQMTQGLTTTRPTLYQPLNVQIFCWPRISYQGSRAGGIKNPSSIINSISYKSLFQLPKFQDELPTYGPSTLYKQTAWISATHANTWYDENSNFCPKFPEQIAWTTPLRKSIYPRESMNNIYICWVGRTLKWKSMQEKAFPTCQQWLLLTWFTYSLPLRWKCQWGIEKLIRFPEPFIYIDQ